LKQNPKLVENGYAVGEHNPLYVLKAGANPQVG